MPPAPESAPPVLDFGGGHAVLDPGTGAPVAFTDDSAPDRAFLLDAATTDWHTDEHQWGSGHLVSDRGPARWHRPESLSIRPGLVEAAHVPVPGLRLLVRRVVTGGRLVESYELSNEGTGPATVTALGIQTPFGDLYDGAARSLDRAVHAHVFTAGTWAWVLARPMSGTGRSLGLIVRRGGLRSYAVESRNKNSLSDARGHLVLQVTDHARNPGAFGGQPPLVLDAGSSVTVEWEIGWYDSADAFLAATRPPAAFSAYAAEVGRHIVVEGAEVTADDPGAQVTREGAGRYRVTAGRHDTYTLTIGKTARTEVLFHLPLQEMVRRRARYIMRHQVARERTGLLRHAFVPVDTRTGLVQQDNGWVDWSDGSERIAMPLLLQLATERGWLERSATEPLLDGWARFARAHLLDGTGAPHRGSRMHHLGPRLYDAPWLSQFFHDRYRTTGEKDDLDLAARILDRNLELGGGEHLSLMLSGTALAVAGALESAGEGNRARVLRHGVIGSARHFVRAGSGLPPHEVAYEQSMVAPLIDLLTDAYTLTGDAVFHRAVEERLPWLLAFSGPQPHVRLHGTAIRHWDGYWFGADRLWGDVFPHHWSALTACTLLRLPGDLRTEETDRLALGVLRANMANYRADGSASCAFVMPSCVDGRPAHSSDPLANDQDWHLVLWMRAESEAGPGGIRG
ncbi:hypothetical protein [Streptomyces sp. NPDC002913]